jgi:hypothetical protein
MLDIKEHLFLYLIQEFWTNDFFMQFNILCHIFKIFHMYMNLSKLIKFKVFKRLYLAYPKYNFFIDYKDYQY